jgi:hypothetical protein
MTEKPRLWERQRDAAGTLEPARWFHRFDAYFRPLGPERTIEQAWQLWKQSEAKSSKAKRPNSYWYKAAKEWRWWERAEAWDAHEAEKRHAEEVEAAEQARQQRIDAFKTLLARGHDKVRGGITGEAVAVRAIVEGAKGLRLEYGEPTEITEEVTHTVKLYRFTDNFPDEEETDGEKS